MSLHHFKRALWRLLGGPDQAELRAEVARLQGALCRWGRHEPTCYIWRDPTERCTCGFASVCHVPILSADTEMTRRG